MDQNYIESLKLSAEYQYYLAARQQVLAMIKAGGMTAQSASAYWREELAGFEYMLDASPLIIRHLREHCYHLTGLHAYDYRQHHSVKTEVFGKKLQALRQLDKYNLFVPESPALGGFGHKINGVLVNLDTLKYYESLIAMDRGGLLSFLRGEKNQKKMVLEIGAGWGGFAYQFKTLFPEVCYIIVDLPQSMLFSIVYLKTVFGEGNFYVYEEASFKEAMQDPKKYDFIFLPNYIWPQLNLRGVNLAINMVSFQEMKTVDVEGYVSRLADLGCDKIYSHNRNCSKYNKELTGVETILSCYYRTQEVNLLEAPYTNLDPDYFVSKQAGDYKHLAGFLE